MKPRHYALAAATLGLGVLGLLYQRTQSPPQSDRRPVVAPPAGATAARPANASVSGAVGSQSGASAAPLRSALEGQPALAPPDFSALVTSERPPLADSLGAPDTPPDREAHIVLELLDAYRRTLGAYPAGEDNRQVVNALLGANAQRLPFIPRDHPRLNERGEIVDAWGTPFFFHLESRTSVGIRSAGPDRAMFTPDDLVASSTPVVNKRRIISEGAPGKK